MKKIIILTLLVSITMVSCAQEITCNRAVVIKSFEKQLPKDICLPEGYALRLILSDTTDIDGDGRVDFAAKLRKINVQDGDTTLVILYKQQENGSYTEWIIYSQFI